MQKVVVFRITLKLLELAIVLVLLNECVQELDLKVNVLFFPLFVASIISLVFGYLESPINARLLSDGFHVLQENDTLVILEHLASFVRSLHQDVLRQRILITNLQELLGTQ